MVNSKNINIQSDDKLSIVSVTLGIYFMMMPFDSIPISGMGSLLRIFVLFPVVTILFVKFRFLLEINRLTISFFIYCLMLSISCLYSIDPAISFNNMKRVLLNMVIILCTGGMYEYNLKEIDFLKKSLMIGGLGTLFLTYIFADYSAEGRLTLSINGNRQDQNYLNGYLFFAYIYFLEKLIRKRSLFSAVPVFGIIYFTLLTGSRGPLVSLAGITIVMLLFVLYQDNRLNTRTILIIIAVLALLVLMYQPVLSLLPETVSQRFSAEYIKEHGNTGRTEIWAYLIKRFIQADVFRTLFGHGYATVVLVNEYNHLVAHNLWLDNLIMVGIVGELVFISMQFIYLRAAWKSKDPFVLCSYIGYLIMMLSLSLLSYKPLWNCMIMIIIINNYQNRQTDYKEASLKDGL